MKKMFREGGVCRASRPELRQQPAHTATTQRAAAVDAAQCQYDRILNI